MRLAVAFGLGVVVLAGAMLAAGQAGGQTLYKGVTAPIPMKEVKAEYPARAMTAGTEGLVRLECVVQADGTVGDVRVIEGIDPELDTAAVAALRQWIFKPGTKDGTAVPVTVEVEIGFALRDRGPHLGSPEVHTLDDGTTSPRPLKEMKPAYSAAAKEARIQGSVEMDCVVLPDGTVGDVRVTKKLDPDVDAEAVKTLRRWRFSPGLKDGKPVPVQVAVQMTFTLR